MRGTTQCRCVGTVPRPTGLLEGLLKEEVIFEEENTRSVKVHKRPSPWEAEQTTQTTQTTRTCIPPPLFDCRPARVLHARVIFRNRAGSSVRIQSNHVLVLSSYLWLEKFQKRRCATVAPGVGDAMTRGQQNCAMVANFSRRFALFSFEWLLVSHWID